LILLDMGFIAGYRLIGASSARNRFVRPISQ
jgi:hypothetical protein